MGSVSGAGWLTAVRIALFDIQLSSAPRCKAAAPANSPVLLHPAFRPRVVLTIIERKPDRSVEAGPNYLPRPAAV
jgi:hypothetical protein